MGILTDSLCSPQMPGVIREKRHSGDNRSMKGGHNGKNRSHEFVSLDGVMEAPGGGEDFKHGG
jgi:hypothetical protein